jgi:hypothetical protein
MIARIRELFGRQADWRRRRSTVVLTWLALAAVILLQAEPFTYGYRRSADEVTFLAVSFNGWRSVEEMAVSLALFQGRLGLAATTLLNTLGSYLSQGLLARWVFVLLHFGVFALFAAYFSIISATNVTRALLLFLVAFQTIGGFYDHMPPVLYPLQNTLPFLALLVARCVIVLVQQRDRGRSLLWPARAIFLLAMLTTEFAFLLATALMAAEHSFALAWRRRSGASIGEALLATIKQRTFLYDVAIVALALFPYLVFRWLYPSSYVGNVIDASHEIGRVVETTVRHVLAGTVLYRDAFPLLPLSPQSLPVAMLIGVLTTACLFAVLHEVRDLQSPLLVALGSALAMAYVTFPLASNARQQDWCLGAGACGYLDSRISYLGFAVIVICLIALVLRRMTSARASQAAVAAVAIATGLFAATTYARNLREGLEMMVDGRAWERATLLACYPDQHPADDRRLSRLIDPERRVRFHPGTDTAQFWRDYMRIRRAHRPCPGDDATRQADRRRLLEYGPTISVGRTVYLSDRSAIQYLGTGWAYQEPPWGVWSERERADLHFLPRPATIGDGLQLRMSFRPYIPPSVGRQTITVSVNGRPVDTWIISKEMHDEGCCERTISLNSVTLSTDEVDVTFHIRRPRNPSVDQEILDNRHLGLFLHSMALVESPNDGR